MTGILIFLGAQITIGSCVGSVLGWEIGKKLNYKRLGEKSRFAPSDLIRTHAKWSDLEQSFCKKHREWITAGDEMNCCAMEIEAELQNN